MLRNWVEAKQDGIAQLCERYHVERLALFGSALRQDFDEKRSDVNLLVRFAEMPPKDLPSAYFGLKEDLEALLGVRVDLVTEQSLKNPYVRAEIGRSQVELYPGAQ